MNVTKQGTSPSGSKAEFGGRLELALLLPVGSFVFLAISLMVFSRGSSEIFLFSLKQANPVSMLLVQLYPLLPYLLILAFVYTASNVLAQSGQRDNFHFGTVIYYASYIVMFQVLTKSQWLIFLLMLIFIVIFRILVYRFKKSQKLNVALKLILQSRIWVKKERNYLLGLVLALSLLINPSGSWMPTEIISGTDGSHFSAFILETSSGIRYLTIEKRTLGYLDNSKIENRTGCSILPDFKPWISFTKSNASRKC